MKKNIEVSGHNILPHILEICKYMDENGLKVRPFPSLQIKKDSDNASDIFGKTAYYNPQDSSIALFTENRHPKDILRSFAHEMIHHKQNLEGKFSKLENIGSDPKYAQNDKHLRKMEEEAYLLGNMMFRDYCDSMLK
jgi:hypothetical protein